jgi:RNA polymerase sporulation-specific sigma factor
MLLEKSEIPPIEHLVNKVKKSGCQRSFDAISEVMVEYIGRIKYQFFIPGMSKDDIEQECLIALRYKAVPDFNSECGSFLPFAKLCIRRHIITVMKGASNNKQLPLNNALSLNMEIDSQDSDDDTMTLAGAIPIDSLPLNKDHKWGKDGLSRLSRKDQILRLCKRLIDSLTTLEAIVLELYAHRLSYKEAVDEMKRQNIQSPEGNDPDTKMIDNSISRIKGKAKRIWDDFTQEEGFLD